MKKRFFLSLIILIALSMAYIMPQEACSTEDKKAMAKLAAAMEQEIEKAGGITKFTQRMTKVMKKANYEEFPEYMRLSDEWEKFQHKCPEEAAIYDTKWKKMYGVEEAPTPEN